MQESFGLDTQEIIYLASLLDHRTFPFLEFDWGFMGTGQLENVVGQCLSRLEKKRYIDVGFDGTVVMNTGIYDFINTAASCRLYFQQLIQTDQTRRTLVIIGEEKMFEMDTMDNDRFQIQEIFGFPSLQARIISRWQGLKEDRSASELKKVEENELPNLAKNAIELGGSMFSLSQYVLEHNTYVKHADLSFLEDTQGVWQIERHVQNGTVYFECMPSNMPKAMSDYAKWFRKFDSIGL